MPSTSSKKNIAERTVSYWEKNKIFEKLDSDEGISISNIQYFLENEYNIIPEKERIGKGGVYIANAVASASISIYKSLNLNDSDLLNFILKMFEKGENDKDKRLQYYAMYLLGEFAGLSKSNTIKALNQAKIWANHEEWDIRETAGFTIRVALKNFPKITIFTLKNWVKSENENERRIVSESLRPLSDIKWLRDPAKNNEILEILSIILMDSSVYVRKSVGNNLKDLTKYMPQKILNFAEAWIKRAKIEVIDELASKTKSELGNENWYLIWTLKHAFRWIKERNPECHTQLESILGKNYVLYFDEKKNKLALRK